MMTLTQTDPSQRPTSYILINTDGACSGNPGPGGYAAVLRRIEQGQETKRAVVKGGETQTTNNRMEMMAVIMGLRKVGLDEPLPIIIRSDSQLVVKGMTEWLPNWVARDWRGSNKKPVMNRDLWEALITLTDGRPISFEWVKGHDGDDLNEEVDGLAFKEAQRRK